MKTAILVVMYGKEMLESKTIQGLMSIQNENSRLTICNNGPSIIEKNTVILNKLNKNHDSVFLYQHPENKPLSHLYNDFIFSEMNVGCSRFIILDDDTNVDVSFFQSLNKDYDTYHPDIQLPKIISIENGRTYYPVVNQKVILSNGIIPLFDGDKLFSIGSGLVIYRSLIEKMINCDMLPFDVRFALYGVDYSFFRRVMLILGRDQKFIVTSSFSLNHSLSRTSHNDSKSRKLERLYDVILSNKHYPKKKKLVYYYFLTVVFKQLAKFEFYFAWQCIIVFFKGQHPRC
ncbi:TPA: hypothetical protein ACNV5T_001778 [Klebsiella michiganensis]|nr:hypothetical protein [Klebsiella michiganensis]HCE9048994.1 hypothetical protein [Klebsiella michiganensis]